MERKRTEEKGERGENRFFVDKQEQNTKKKISTLI